MNELSEWGKWVRHNPDNLTYKSQWFGMILRDNTPNKTISYDITDKRACDIDRAVCVLRSHYTVLYQVLFAYYVLGWSYRKIAKKYLTPLKCPKQLNASDGDTGKKYVHPQTVKRMLQEAERQIYDFINQAGEF